MMANPSVLHDPIDRLKATIHDDAKRSVSFRMYTSDYGRLRCMSNELRVGDSAVFRFLLRVALEKCAPLYDRNASPAQRLELLADLGPEFATYFNFDVDELKAVFQRADHHGQVVIDDEDFDLVAAFGISRSLVRKRIEKLVGRETSDENLHDVLRDYLVEKYLADGESVSAPRSAG